MNIKFKLKYSTIIYVCFALYAFFSLNPVFTWSTFMGGILGSLWGMQYMTAFAVVGVIFSILFMSKRKTQVHGNALWETSPIGKRAKYFIIGFLAVIAFSNVAISSNFEDVFTFLWISYIVIGLFIILPGDIQYKTYQLYYNIFVITLIIPIIIFILQTIGLHLPSIPLESYEAGKRGIGVSYHLYPFALNRVQRYQTKLYGRQLCAIYDEPGRVGTQCGLMLCAEQFRLKNHKKNIILLIAGIMSFSLAFYLIMLIYGLVKSIMTLNRKGAFVLGAIFLLYVGFINISFKNPEIQRFQQRFLFVNGTLSGDNRSNDKYESIMDGVFSDGLKEMIWGHGAGASSEIQTNFLIDGSSYKKLLYDYGFLGSVNQIIWLFVLGFSSLNPKNKTHVISLIIAYIANMYQRPSMFSFQFMLILFGGIIAAADNDVFLEEKTDGRQ